MAESSVCGDDDERMFASYLDSLTKHLSKYNRAHDDGRRGWHCFGDDVVVGTGTRFTGSGDACFEELTDSRDSLLHGYSAEPLSKTRNKGEMHQDSFPKEHNISLQENKPQAIRHDIALTEPCKLEEDSNRATYQHISEGDSGLEEQLGAYRQRDTIYQEEMSALQKENSSLHHQIRQMRSKIQTLTFENREGDAAKDKIRRLERYLKTVPTEEEFQKETARVAQLVQVESQLREELMDVQTHKHQLNQQIHKLQQNNSELMREVKKLRQDVLETGEMKNTAVEETRAVLRQVTLERDNARQLYERVSKEVASRIAEAKSTQQQLDLERKVLEEQRHQIQLRERHIEELLAKEAEFVRSERHLRASLMEAEDLRESLLRKLSAQSTTIRDLRESISALSKQNQSLVSINQALRSGRPDLVSSTSLVDFEGSIAEQKASGHVSVSEVNALQDELGKTLQEFARVFDLAISRVNNSEDDVRRLLGFSSSQDTPLFVRTTDVSSRLESIREMQRFIQKLEAGINDAYAHDVGHQACGIQ